ncbi:hypothetical protein QM012_006565 [Aureobasidium pullulans]|uniref:Uncharacterized protein n=1 Tax=Aureobasidium pullulans TaxID=5580 RepID=A0ABR0TQL0_AURPU
MGDTTAAIVWGISVDPVDFLSNLDAFRKALPAIHSLRLCNQFGQGEKAAITKLPRELIEVIEEELLALHHQQEKSLLFGWSQKYRCFEGSCRASDHMDADHLGMHEDVVENAEIRLHQAHPEWSTAEGFEFPENYQNLLDEEVASRLDELADEYTWEYCFETKMKWVPEVRKHMCADGNNDVLRRHFGLEGFIMHENLNTSTIAYLKSNVPRYSYEVTCPEKATICYLILPTQSAQWTVRLDPNSIDSGEYYGESASSMLVDRNSLDLNQEHQKRFARAMLRLGLKPSVHPSQLYKTLSATSSVGDSTFRQVPPPAADKNASTEERKKRDAITTERIRSLNESQWPKLMFLVNTDCCAF